MEKIVVGATYKHHKGAKMKVFGLAKHREPWKSMCFTSTKKRRFPMVHQKTRHFQNFGFVRF